MTYRRQNFLCNDAVRAALRAGILDAQQKHPFTIDGWVLLPNHLHCIWTLPEDDADFGIRWAMNKRFVTKQCGSDIYRDDGDYETHMAYLHYNPVKHGLVKHARDWPHATFHRYVREGVYDESWGDKGKEKVDGDFGE